MSHKDCYYSKNVLKEQPLLLIKFKKETSSLFVISQGPQQLDEQS